MVIIVVQGICARDCVPARGMRDASKRGKQETTKIDLRIPVQEGEEDEEERRRMVESGRKDGWDEDDVDKKSQDETAVMGIN
jgi:hypothetical protein